MSELVITPNLEKKTARFKGIVAAGEHASIRIVGASGISATSIRLRIVFIKETLAVFPLAQNDAWAVDGEDLTCEINLNTTQMVKAFRRLYEAECLVVLDDVVNHQLHFSDLCLMRGWPQSVGEDTPVDLDGYADFVSSTEARLSAAESAVAANAQAIADEAEARENADAEHVSQISEVAVAVSGKADASALDSLATKSELASEKSSLQQEIAGKQDAGSYLTEHQSLEGLATTASVNAALAGKANTSALEGFATKTELAAEADARSQADVAHMAQDEANAAGIASLQAAVQHAEEHITTHALETDKHQQASNIRALIAKTLSSNTYDMSTFNGMVDAVVDIITKLGGATNE